MTEDQIQTLRDSADQLRDLAYSRYEYWTADSCTNRQDWSYEQKCRYGGETAWELSQKLDKMADAAENET